MTKVCISGYYGFKNFGDEAILSVLCRHLKELKDVDITVFSSNSEFTSSTYQVNSVNSFDLTKIINTIKNSDILISGGGSLLQDVTSIKSLIYYLFIISMALFFKKKVIIFAQGIGPLNSNIAKFLVKNTLKYCSYISVRDEKSQQILLDWNIKSNLVCDPIFSMNIEKETTQNAIGIQLRDFKTMNYNLLHKLALLIVTKYSDKKIEIFSLQQSQDLELCKRFQKLLNNFNPDIKSEIVTQDIVKRISNLNSMIAMRFHAIIVALIAGIKTCAINYDEKVKKLANEADIPLISMDAHENLEYIYQKIENLDEKNLLKFAHSKKFDFEQIDKLLSE